MPGFDWKNIQIRSEEHTSELQSHDNLVCCLLLEKKKSEMAGLGPGGGGGCAGVFPCGFARAVGAALLAWPPGPSSGARHRRTSASFFLMNRRPPSPTPFPYPALSQ